MSDSAVSLATDGRPATGLATPDFLNSARDGVVATNAAGQVTEWNPSAERMLGWLRHEAIGRPLSAVIVPAHAEESHESGLEPYLKSGAARGLDGLVEIEVQHRDGRLITVELSIFSLPSADGEGSGLFMRDVSERQSTQKALRQSEERYRSLVEHLGEGMAVLQDGKVMFANARAAAVMRINPEALIGADFLQWLHPDDRHIAAQRQRLRQHGDNVPDHYELRTIDDDGKVLWMDVHATSVPWEGRPATMSFFSDITERKAVSEALRTSEERYRAVVEHLSEGMLVIQDEKVVYANARAAEIAGMPLSEMQQIGFLMRIHPDDHALVLDRQRRRLAGEVLPDHYELRLLLPGNVVRWVAIGVAVVPWGGKPAALTFFTDVTESKQMMEEVRTSEARLRAVVEHAGEGMVVVVETDKPVFINSRALEIMRMTREEVDERGYLQLFHPDDLGMILERRQRRLAGDPVLNRYEVRLVDRDGSVRWIELGTTIVPWSGQKATMSFFADITDRKMMIEAMHRSEERYRAVVEHVGEGMVVVQDGRFVFVNKRATLIARRPYHDMMNSGFTESIHPDDRAMVLERQRRRIAGENVPSRYELRLLHQDGSITWIEIGVTMVPWDGKDATLTFFSDVSHRKALESKLRDTLTERETILENSLVGIAFLTQDQRLRWSNRAMSRIFGASSGSVEPDHWSELFPSHDDYVRVNTEIAARMREKLAFEGEIQLKRLDGALFWASVTGKAVNAADAGHGTVWTVMDVTERKELEVALQRTSSEREAIFKSVLVGVAFNVNRHIQWVNDKFCEMMGFERDEVVGRSSRLFYSDDAQFASEGAVTLQHLRSDGFFTTERLLFKKTGEPIWVQLSGRCVFDKNPDAGAIWTLLDITDRKRAEDDVRAALARQKELNELRSRFVSMTSHEFRTPLATILSSAELIKYYGDRMPAEEKQEILQSIESGVQRMTRMLDRMLLIGKADAQMLEFNPERLDLQALCGQCVDEVRTANADRAADIVCEFASDRPEGEFDEKLLRHVFGNLLSNAVKYSPDGGTVRFRVSDLGPRWLFEVSDQGIGIPAQEIGHLFESFHRASNVGSIQGTGLGLAIVKKAVEVHGGTIDVKSDAGQGACFRVVL